MKDKVIYIGEYSPEQKAYNIDTLEDIIEINLTNMANDNFNGYIPVCYGYSVEEVRKQLDNIEKELGRP